MNHLVAYKRSIGADGRMGFVASTPGIKRDGKDLRPERWLLENFRKNPVFLWSHQYDGKTLPIGRVPFVGMERNALVCQVEFDDFDPFAQQVKGKYERGFLNSVSVGWNPVVQNGENYQELLDISAVNVPGDPDALKRAFQSAGEGGYDALAAKQCRRLIGESEKIQGYIADIQDLLHQVRKAYERGQAVGKH